MEEKVRESEGKRVKWSDGEKSWKEKIEERKKKRK